MPDLVYSGLGQIVTDCGSVSLAVCVVNSFTGTVNRVFKVPGARILIKFCFFCGGSLLLESRLIAATNSIDGLPLPGASLSEGRLWDTGWDAKVCLFYV